MKDILVLVTPQPLLRAIQKYILEEDRARVDIQYCKNLNGIIDFIDKKLPSSVEVIISTPGPSFFIAQLIKKKIPILPLEYNNIDIIKSLHMALSVCPGGVAYGHYLQETQWLDDIRKMVGQDFGNFLFGNDDATNADILRKLQGRGVRAIVGGGYICNIAQEMGFLVFPVEVNRFTVKETIHKALSIADTQKYARYSQKNIDTILSNQAEAVITVDQDNEITFFNKSAEKLFAVSGADVIGRKSWNIFPQNTFEAVLKGGEPQETHPHTVHGVDIVGNYRPVFDNGSVIGAVGTFSTMTDIQKKDEFIRKYYAPKTAQAKHSFDDFYGGGLLFQELLERARCFAQTDETILITGESGTGKEVMAGSIHNASRRGSKPFLSINSAAIPATLMESELFGYEPGAFSGANSGGQKGLLEQAHTGTFFLDEVSEMPVSLQVKLLRVLQERVVRRVGGKVNHSVDIRIIAASNRNLRELVAQGAFREDLFFRLDVIPLFVPPLRERQGDIRLLVAHFLQSFSRERGCTYRVATELMHAFEAYPWPGNVRELKNFVEYGVGFCEHGVLTLDLMDSRFKTASPPPVKTEKGMPSPPPGPARDTAEYDRIMQLLGRYGQHTEGKKRTASELGISLATLYRRMGQLGITARKHAR